MQAVDGMPQDDGRGELVAFPVGMGMMAVLLLLLVGGQAASAVEQGREQEEPPSREMLEFLGDWQTKEGVWFDPTVKEPKPVPPQEQSHD